MKKKKIILLLLFLICGMFAFSGNVYAEDVTCGDAFGGAVIDGRIPEAVSNVIKAIQIAVPILLVIFGMIDLVKGLISQKEDEIKKGQQVLIKRVIVAVLIFFVVAIVKFIVSVVAPSDSDGNSTTKDDILNCFDCFVNNDCDASSV